MLSTDSKLRPSAEAILDLDIVKKKINKLFPQEEMEMDDEVVIEEDEEDEDKKNQNGLLQTIRVPNNLAQLTKRLPRA